MKTTIFLIGLVFSMAIGQSSFCAGYEIGFERGYCYEKFGCIPLITPICPIPRIGRSTFNDGMDRGFADGMARR